MKHASACQTLSLEPKDDIYIYSILPYDSTTSYLALRSDDKITAFTTDSRASSPILWTLPASHSSTTCISVKAIDSRPWLLTAGISGSIKIWDPRSSLSHPQQTLSPTSQSTAPILSLATHDSSPTLAAGTELTNHEAAISFWDLRSPGQVVHRYIESHSDDISVLHFHPSNPAVLLSGSTDGLVNIYDSRVADEDEALLQVLNHGASVHKADFLTGAQGEGEGVGEMEGVWALSSDEQMSLYRLLEPGETEAINEDEEQDPSVCAFGDVRPVLGCDYVVDVVSTGGGPMVCAGSFSQRRLDLIPLRKTPVWDFHIQDAIRLEKDMGDELVRTVCIDQLNEKVIAGAEDGKIRIWSQIS